VSIKIFCGYLAKGAVVIGSNSFNVYLKCAAIATIAALSVQYSKAGM